jgi:hypothetical protein
MEKRPKFCIPLYNKRQRFYNEFSYLYTGEENLQQGFKIDKDLPNRLDHLLKAGSLEQETEILKILETLSEKLNALNNKKGKLGAIENVEEKNVNRIHRKWGSSSFE